MYIFAAMKIKFIFLLTLAFVLGSSQVLITSIDSKQTFEFTDKTESTYSNGSEQLLDVSQNIKDYSSSKITISSFPLTKPEFKLGSSPNGWTYLNVSTIIKVKNPENINLVDVDGFTHVKNTSGDTSYQFAIGVFVDNQLKMVKEFEENAKSGTCNSAKFDLSGVFENLSTGEHTVKVYAYNLPKTTSGYSSITYGGNALDSCKVDDKEDGKIHLTVQYSE